MTSNRIGTRCLIEIDEGVIFLIVRQLLRSNLTEQKPDTKEGFFGKKADIDDLDQPSPPWSRI